MLFNYDIYSVSFDRFCLDSSHLDLLNQFNFYHHSISRGYISSLEFSNFVSILEDIPSNYSIVDCLIDISFEELLEIQDCKIQNTSSIYYNQTLKPSAWNLDLLDNVSNVQYMYPSHSFEDTNITIWILDTGINWKHNEFYKNQVIDLDPSYNILNLTHPHGTGVAGCASGKNYGSSKNFTIFNFPVCRYGGSCGSSSIDKAFHLILNYTRDNPKKRSVINMSVGSYMAVNPNGTSIGKYYNDIFKGIEENGGIVVVSAGNSNQDACLWLYSYSPYVISVGSLDQNYQKSSFSNYGDCVDIWTFGSNVLTAYSIIDPSVIQYKSGTSFSAPLVTGLVANLLSQNISYTKQDILKILSVQKDKFIVPKYSCNETKCCRSSSSNTRQDKYCKSLSIGQCNRNCIIKSC